LGSLNWDYAEFKPPLLNPLIEFPSNVLSTRADIWFVEGLPKLPWVFGLDVLNITVAGRVAAAPVTEGVEMSLIDSSFFENSFILW